MIIVLHSNSITKAVNNSMIHQINILIHVFAGTLALIAGIVALLLYKGSIRHIQWGRYFLYILSVVVLSGFLGWLFFRSNSFLLMLTILSGYVGYAGWRTIRLKENRGSIIDMVIALTALTLGLMFLMSLDKADDSWNPVVIHSTLSALVLVTVYDILKFLWLHPFIKRWWLYEHIYKMTSAFSAIFSAFIGTVLPDHKPWSQIGPSSLCVLLIIFMIWRQVIKRGTGSVVRPMGEN